MSAQHTPGPWHTGGINSVIIYDANGNAVADAKVYHLAHGGLPACQANARLIAAAPDLLAALSSLEARVRNGAFSDGEWDEDALEKASAAIAKAEGKEVGA